MELTTIANVQNWTNSNSNSATQSNVDNDLLLSLIRSTSSMIMNYIQRPNLFRATYNEVRNGVGNEVMMLRNWPVILINSLKIGQTVVNAQPSPDQAGYILEPLDVSNAGRPQSLYLCGYAYPRGFGNVYIGYQAGYSIVGEPQTAASSIQAAQPLGRWAQDDGVTYANGTPFVAVASSPAQGQYSVAAGTYQFNSADFGQAVLISYSYVPSDIEQACIETVAERYRYKNRVGQKSVTVMQTVSSFDNSGLTQYGKMLLNPYRKVIPI